MTTTIPVWIIRLVEKTGSSDTAGGTLPSAPPGDSLEPLDDGADGAHGGGEDRVGAPHRGDQAGAGEEVGDVVLAEVDEAEAEGERVGPADRPLLRARFGQRCGGGDRGGEVER